MSKVMRALGLMSGTSLDGIDVAYLETDGETVAKRGPALTYAYDDRMRDLLATAIADAKTLKSRDDRPASLSGTERELTDRHAAAVAQFLEKTGIDRAAIDLIGFHGQTVLHRPEAGLSVQLGLGERLADATRCPVIYDLRAADVAAGGQGAPLAPVYHRALTTKLPARPLAIVNIGGVANVTWIGRDGSLMAFDTGPGNALLDDWMKQRAGFARDENGEAAAQGNVDDVAVRHLLCDGYFTKPPPKSLDRNAFSADARRRLSTNDGAATLAAFTAQADRQIAGAHARRTGALDRCGRWAAQSHDYAHAGRAGPHAVVPAEAVGSTAIVSRRKPGPISPFARSKACRSRFLERRVSPSR